MMNECGKWFSEINTAFLQLLGVNQISNRLQMTHLVAQALPCTLSKHEIKTGG